MNFLFMSLQVSFLIKRLNTLVTLVSGEKRRMDSLHMQLEVSLQSEGLFTVWAFLFLAIALTVSFTLVASHILLSFETFFTNRAREAHTPSLRKWYSHGYTMDLSVVSLEVSDRDEGLTKFTLFHFRSPRFRLALFSSLVLEILLTIIELL